MLVVIGKLQAPHWKKYLQFFLFSPVPLTVGQLLAKSISLCPRISAQDS